MMQDGMMQDMLSLSGHFPKVQDTLSQLSTGLLLPDAVHRIFEEGQVSPTCTPWCMQFVFKSICEQFGNTSGGEDPDACRSFDWS